ncbi:hypothetical protein [Stenotrophomonas maltophilia]|uniref:hypothetical protein n=1 Tax=Stenotrophomonas maltophilia TaxID=40324 RepID=UPI000F675AA4|nr:hypothetical protein [Stenotrophomonas maltophilia]
MSVDLTLSVSRDIRRSPRHGHTRAGESDSMDALRGSVLGQGRHGRRCASCSVHFGAWDGFELTHLDGDHSNDRLENLAPICRLCHWSLHLDLIVRKNSSEPGVLIYLPELEQFELNQLLYAIGAYECEASEPGGPQERIGWKLYGKLEGRSAVLEGDSATGERAGLSKIHSVVRLLQDVKDERYATRSEWLHGCRYLPALSEVLKESAELRKHGAAFAAIPFASWSVIKERRS